MGGDRVIIAYYLRMVSYLTHVKEPVTKRHNYVISGYF